MAIATGTGTAGNDSTGTAVLLNLPSITPTNGRDLVFHIVLGSTTQSVASITNSAGTYGTPTLRKAVNGSGIRIEIWTVHVTTGAATVFTINITGAATIACAVEEYSGVTGWGNTSTQNGTGQYLYDRITLQQNANWVATGMGWLNQTGDTSTAQLGNSRQSTIPAATAVAAIAFDTTTVVGAPTNMTYLNNSRTWVTASLEMLAGGAAVSPSTYASSTAVHWGDSAVLAMTGGSAWSCNFMPKNLRMAMFATSTPAGTVPVPVAQVLAQGAIGFAYSETIGTSGGIGPYTYSVSVGSLPSGTSLNTSTGVISGTPTAAGTFSFSITVTDSNGNTGTQPFQISIVSPIIAGGTWGWNA